MNEAVIVALDDANAAATRQFLERDLDSSLILLGNLAEHGPRLGAHMNSGNFRAVVENGAVVAVFCLTRRGNLLVQCGGRRDLSARILAACAEDGLPFNGVIGEFTGAESAWKELCARPDFRPGFASREILYAVTLDRPLPAAAHEVRLTTPQDFERWDALMHDFCKGEGMPFQGNVEQRRAGFDGGCAAGVQWAGLAGSEIVSTAVLLVFRGSGRIGAVYTAPEHRRRGISRAVLLELMRDSRERLGLSRLVLYTGEDNTAAQALYQ
ncbi:MAG TPA: N-acetyltransferase, partial [Polyangiaceae bacterium]|nr:N-acetyltransferase [Polyangiaceae bacterium]